MLVHVPIARNSQGWDRPKSGTQNPVPVYCMGGGDPSPVPSAAASHSAPEQEGPGVEPRLREEAWADRRMATALTPAPTASLVTLLLSVTMI